MIDQTDDTVQLDEDRIASKAAEIAKQGAVEAAKESLIESIRSEKPKYSWEESGRKAPSNYDELFGEVEKRAISPDKAREIARQEFSELQKQKEIDDAKREDDTRKKQVETIKERAKQFDADWYDLVGKGKLPAPSKDIQERIEKGEKLTRAEIDADEGLAARLKLMETMQATGKSAKVAFYEDFEQQHAGARAPVFGGRPSVPSYSNKDEDYDDLHAETIRRGLIK